VGLRGRRTQRAPREAPVDRAVEELADALVAAYAPGTLLDIGCAAGELVCALERREVGGAAGLDVSGRSNERRLSPAVKDGSALDLPYRDRNFDVVLGRDVLVHLDPADVPRALAEQARVTRIGGRVLHRVPVEDAWLHHLDAVEGLELTGMGAGPLALYVELTRR